MNIQPAALVIGAGLGGIAAAARLARSGYRVTVLEKNARPGGRCDQLVREGHRFDIGPTLFLMPEVFAETYAALGERIEDHLDLRRIDPTYRIRFEDGVQLSLTGDLNNLRSQLEAFEPGSFETLLRYLAEGHIHYHTSLERFVGRNFYNLLDYFSLQNLPLLFKLKALVKHYDHIGRYFQDPHLKAGFTFQDMYLGLSPYDAPATYSLLQYTELAGGVWFPMGGLYRVVESLVSIAEAQGVHNVFLASDYRGSFDRIFKDHTLPDRPSFYVHAPARVDPAAAPAGQDSLFVLVPAGHLDKDQDWSDLRRRARTAVFDRLTAVGIPELESHLKFEITFTSETWLHRYNLAKGAAFGLSHNFWQVGYLRPHNRHTRYGNLYFVGSSTHPGTGLPMVLLSARLTVERILQEMPYPRRVSSRSSMRPETTFAG